MEERSSGDSKKRSAVSSRLKMGPGMIVAAAFVGPGTVTTAAKAGADHGFGLIWAVLLSIAGVMILQEMASRLGTLTSRGLGEILRRQSTSRFWTIVLGLLILAAIGFGNAAYQTGNLMGAALGIGALLNLPIGVLVIAIGVIAFVLLWSASYKLIERVLMAAVAVMGLAFVAAATLALLRRGVSLSELKPTWPSGDYRTLLALVGTTIVPYNLFLHASAAAERWGPVRPRSEGLRLARMDSFFGIALGGVVTLAILVASAAALGGTKLDSAVDAAQGLESILGHAGAKIAFALGFTAAGITSAITAPLAAAYAISGVFGLSTEKTSWTFRAIWGLVLSCGVVAGVTLGSSPTETIIAAQAANTLVLPVIVIVLLLACNAKILGKYANRPSDNVLAIVVIVFILALSVGRWFV